MSQENPYAPPSSPLQQSTSTTQAVDVHDALARGYDFSISGIISEAWRLLPGSKLMICGGLLVSGLIVILISVLLGVIAGVSSVLATPENSNFVISLLSQILGNALISIILYPFMAGIYMMAIRRVAGQSVSFGELFAYFSQVLPLTIAALLIGVFTSLGFLLLILPGIYLSVAYMMTVMLIAERGLSAWQAMEISRRAITQHWFKFFGLLIVLSLINIVGAMLLLVGLIWTVPLSIIAVALVYRTIFGIREQA